MMSQHTLYQYPQEKKYHQINISHGSGTENLILQSPTRRLTFFHPALCRQRTQWWFAPLFHQLILPLTRRLTNQAGATQQTLCRGCPLNQQTSRLVSCRCGACGRAADTVTFAVSLEILFKKKKKKKQCCAELLLTKTCSQQEPSNRINLSVVLFAQYGSIKEKNAEMRKKCP